MVHSRVIARNSFWIGLDTLVGFVSALIGSVAVARVLGPQKLGYYNYVLWVTTVAGSLAAFGVPSATRKYVAEFLGRGELGVARAIVRSTFLYQCFSGLAMVAGGLLVVWAWVPPPHRTYAALAVVSLFPTMLLSIASAANFAAEDLAANVWPSLVSMPVNLLGVVLSLVFHWDLIGLTAALLVSRVVDCVLRYHLFLRRSVLFAGPAAAASAGRSEQPPIPAELRRRMVRFCWQSTILLIINMVVWDRSEMLFLKHFCDIREVTFYSLSFNILTQLLFLPRVFAEAAGATLMVQQGRDPSSMGPMAATTVRFLGLLALPLTLGMVALSSPAIRLLYGQRYVEAIPVLAVVALFSIPRAFLLPARQLLIASDNQNLLVKWGVVTALLNLGLDYSWIPGGGAIGAAFANGVSQLVAATGIWVLATRRFTVPLAVQVLLKILACSVLMAALVAGVAYVLPPLPATAGGVVAGAVAFLWLLRRTRCLDRTDRDRLLSVQRQLPGWLRGWYAQSVQMVIP